jgi:DNA-binding CsgD family transcriptional regulator
MLMLLDRWADSRDVCRRAVAIAQSVHAREAEGHARNTLGLDLVSTGRCDDARRELETARAIALEVGNADDLGRAYVNLSETLFFCGWGPEAVACVEEGTRVAERYGMTSSYGAFLRHNGIVINFELGHWDTALRLARESVQIAQAGPHIRRYGLSRWVPLSVASGDFELAATQLDALAELLEGGPVEGQFSGNYHLARAELALWLGRPAEALDEAEIGLERLAGSEWPWYLLRLHRLAARAAADLALVGRARRDQAVEAEAMRRGEANREARERIVAAAREAQAGAPARETLAEAATAAAEDGRRGGVQDAGAWRAVRERWEEHGRPYPAAYAGWREAEALLEAGDRAPATEALRAAHVTARRLGAHPLVGAIESLAGRARIALDAPEGAPQTAIASAQPPTPGDPYGLTRREREVLGLVALGRTNRQIADTLFISENTAGVHVSNILGKLGVASRTEAAAVAVRAGYPAPDGAANDR